MTWDTATYERLCPVGRAWFDEWVHQCADLNFEPEPYQIVRRLSQALAKTDALAEKLRRQTTAFVVRPAALIQAKTSHPRRPPPPPAPPPAPPKRVMPRSYRGPEVQRDPDISFVWTVPSQKPTPAVSYQVVFPRVECRRSVEELWTSTRPERAPLWQRLGPDLVEDEDPEVPPMWCRKKVHHFPQTLIGPGPFCERSAR